MKEDENEMTNEEYVKAALRTESLSDEVRHRFADPRTAGALAYAVSHAVLWIRTVDAFKKFLFYGKWDNAIQKTMESAIREPTHGQVLQPYGDSVVRLIHSAMGMLTETGELLEGLCGPADMDRVNLIEEIGDVFWYQAIAADVLKTSFDEIQERNIAKLKARYPGKFENERAVNRDLEVERQVLEGGGGCAPVEVENG